MEPGTTEDIAQKLSKEDDHGRDQQPIIDAVPDIWTRCKLEDIYTKDDKKKYDQDDILKRPAVQHAHSASSDAHAPV